MIRNPKVADDKGEEKKKRKRKNTRQVGNPSVCLEVSSALAKLAA
jgi:hypothetical protein